MKNLERLPIWLFAVVTALLLYGVEANAGEERSIDDALAKLGALLHSDQTRENEINRLQQVDVWIGEMKKANQLAFTNAMLVPNWDIEGNGLALLAANNYHPSVHLQDLNEDGKTDLLIAARQSGRITSPYYFLLYLQNGNSLSPALQYQTMIANKHSHPKAGYQLIEDQKPLIFMTWKSTVQNAKDRVVETAEVKVPIRKKSGWVQPAIPLGDKMTYTFALTADRGNQDALVIAPENDDSHLGVIGKWFYPNQETKSSKPQWPIGTWTGSGCPPADPARHWWDYTLSINADKTVVFTEVEHHQAYDEDLKPVGEEESYLRLQMTGTWTMKDKGGIFTLKREK